MALNRYSTSSRFSPKTTDPITKARIADPNKMGKVSPQGTTMITSWPELRESYKRGELPDDLLTGGQGDIPKDIVSYMKGETDILSERYAEPEYNINPDTQKVGHYRDPADPKFTVGDVYDSDGNVGKKNVYHMRYDAENKQNRSKLNRARKHFSDYNYKMSDYIQGDTSSASGEGSSGYTEDQMSALYPDLQVGGDVGMSDFGQSVYSPSKKQIAEEKKRESQIPPPPPPSEAETKAFMEEGPSRLKLIKPGMLKGEDRELVGLDRDRGEYVDPKKPFVSYEKGSKEKFPNKKARRKANLEALFKKDGLGASKPERVKGRFKNLGEKRKYKKEEKLAKATYGRGFEQLTGTELEERKANLKEMKREQMSPFKRDYETNKITGINKPRFFKNLSINQDARKEIRDINRAQKYSKLVGGSETNRNVYSVSDRVSRNMIDKEKNPGPKYFKPEVMKNFRSSDDNPLNRNSSSRFFK